MFNYLLLSVLILLVFITPIFTIGMLNTLFSTHLPITLQTYLAALWLGVIVAGGLRPAARKA